jgi:thiol-disulfide isomerase/thioredoxin
MFEILRRLFTVLIVIGSFSSLGLAQSEAFIMGKIDEPASRIVRFEFKRNHFSLEEGIFETILDANNTFSIRVKIAEPRAINLTHHDRAVRLYLEPGDTLRMRFQSAKMIETITLESTAAIHNDYMLESQKAFPDWINQTLLETARQEMTARDYQNHVDEIYTNKRRFFDQYSTILKANFTNSFLEFVTNDLNYWRAYELMMYVKSYGLNNPDPKRQIEDTYFNFLFETDNISQLALTNEYYLQYLDLYLGYMREKDGRGKMPGMEVVEEKSRYVQTVKPKGRNLVVLEEPYLTSSVVSWLNPNEEAIYQSLSTSEKFKYILADSTIEDYFYKIRTNDGKSGWIPASLVTKHDKTIVERTIRTRFCFEPTEPLCGFDKHLQGKVLYYMSAKDLLYSFVFEKPDVMEFRYNRYVSQNTSFQEYNTVLKEAFKLTMQDRVRGLQRMNIPVSCELDNNLEDRPQQAILLANMPRKELATKDLTEIKVDIPVRLPEDKPVPTNVTPPTEPTQKETEKPIAETKPPAVEPTAKLTEPVQKETEKPIVETKPATVEPTAKLTEPVQKETEKPIVETKPAVVEPMPKPAEPIQKETEKPIAETKPTALEPTPKPAEPIQKETEKPIAETKPTAVEPTPKPAEPIQKETEKPIAETKPTAVEPTVKPTEPVQKETENQVISVVPDPMPLIEQVIEIKIEAPPTQTPKAEPIVKTETPTGQAVKAEERTFKEPTTSKETKPTEATKPRAFVTGRDSMRLIIKDGRDEIDLSQETVLVPDFVEYDPTLKGVEFKGLRINEAVSPFAFVDINGKEVTPEDLKDKVIVIDFWASYCIPCIENIKHHQNLIEKYKGQDVVFLFVSIDYDKNMVKETLRGKNWQGLYGHDRVILPINFGVQRLPNYFIISKTGRVAMNSLLKSKTDADKMIEKLLKN